MIPFEELSRFSASGKTFFFNKGKAKNGSDYLVVNAIWGKGNQERILLFPPHYLEFRKHISQAIEKLSGIKFLEDSHAPDLSKLFPESCPECGTGSAGWELGVYSGWWEVVCSQCSQVIRNSTGEL